MRSSGDWGNGVHYGVSANNYGTTGRFYWYGDHTIDTALPENSPYAIDRAGATFVPGLPKLQGGMYACSTNDMLSWRNEGIMVCACVATAVRVLSQRVCYSCLCVHVCVSDVQR